ncbi:MAG: hypothetical protein ACJ8G7_19045, partial [Rhizobacter sp.]
RYGCGPMPLPVAGLLPARLRGSGPAKRSGRSAYDIKLKPGLRIFKVVATRQSNWSVAGVSP